MPKRERKVLDIKVQLLMFDACPLAGRARQVLEQALAEVGIEDYEEIDILDPSVPDVLREWGSPTILINGADVSGRAKGDAVGCRIYPGADRVPSLASIVECLKKVA